MEFNDLKKFIKIEDKRLRGRFGNYKDEEKRILARTVKLGEEFGELCDEVLGYNSFQRQEKLDNRDAENLGEEFVARMRVPDRDIRISIPVKMDDGPGIETT